MKAGDKMAMAVGWIETDPTTVTFLYMLHCVDRAGHGVDSWWCRFIYELASFFSKKSYSRDILGTCYLVGDIFRIVVLFCIANISGRTFIMHGLILLCRQRNCQSIWNQLMLMQTALPRFYRALSGLFLFGFNLLQWANNQPKTDQQQ